MQHKASAQIRRSRAAQIAAIFWSSGELWSREARDLAHHGAPPALRNMSAPARADFVVFERKGFVLERYSTRKGEGVRAFLFLHTDEDGEALNIIAWAPQLKRFSTWGGDDPAIEEGQVTSSAASMREHCDQAEAI
jgi:hypothetical protein